jgi:tRNA-uridine 2-sulfurtransferase
MIDSTINNPQKVAIGLSGGVDSAVSAYLLKQKGYEVTGVYMQCWEIKEDGCAADEDKAYAVQTAMKLGIKFQALDFKKEYKKKVIDYFYDEYSKGRTPNPDVVCNREIKFGLFYKWAIKNGFDYIATGHYAKVKKLGKSYQLLKGVDESKDQSYFLYQIKQKQLSKCIFPVGELKKTRVRELALQNELPPAKRPESMGICFIGEVDIKKFLEKRIEHKKGNVLDPNGKIIGDHDGVQFFTIGQRHGFRVKAYSSEPLYVIGKNPEKNELIVGTEKDAYRNNFAFNEERWVGADPFKNTPSIEAEVRIRHLGALFPATITQKDTCYEVCLKEPVFGVASGQSCVLYQGEVVLGGGIIL